MDELLALLERYSPGYRARIKGVHRWRLDELEERFGRPCPGFYREFARRMGAGAGPLLDGMSDYHPSSIAELYELAPERELPPRRFLYILGDPSVDARHHFLDLGAPAGEDDCAVVRVPFGEDAWKTHLVQRYVSLREMLFVLAMDRVALPTFPHRVEFARPFDAAGAAPGAEEVAVIFERLGFARLAHARRCLLFERQDGAIVLYRRPDDPAFSVRVGLRDPAKLRGFQAVVEDAAGLSPWRGAV